MTYEEVCELALALGLWLESVLSRTTPPPPQNLPSPPSPARESRPS